MKFSILIIFKKSCWNFFLSYW